MAEQGKSFADRMRRRGTGGEPDAAALAAELAAAKDELAQTTRRLRETKKQFDLVRLERDQRRAPDDVEAQIAAVRAENLTFLRPPQLRDLALAMIDIERNRTPGIVIEAGTALGGSAIVLATAKSPERPMRVYDVFGLIPEPSERDGADVHERYAEIKAGKATGHAEGEAYYGYRDDLLGEVTASFVRRGVAPAERSVELIQGLFQDTVAVDVPVALANLDGDWYESTKVCLERIAPHVVSGGRIVLDDYDGWSGCREAVDEYFADRMDQWRFDRRHRLHLVRR